MDRRTFIGSVITALTTPTIAFGAQPSSVAILDEHLKHRIVASFPNQTTLGAKNAMGFFLNALKNPKSLEDKFKIQINNFTIDQDEDYNLDEIFPTEIHEISYESNKSEISHVVKAANRIARYTRRDMGNHYAVFSDHILVWYQGPDTQLDGPIINMGKNAFKHPNQNDYFARINNLKLTDENHKQLEEIGFKRIT